MKKLALIFILCVEVFFTCRAQEQDQDQEKYLINLKSRKFVPHIGTNNETLSKLKQQIVTEKKSPHVMVQFKEIPSIYNRELLLNKGIKLLDYLGSNTWYASISDTKAFLFTDPEFISKDPLLGSVHFMGEIAPEDKIARLVREKR